VRFPSEPDSNEGTRWGVSGGAWTRWGFPRGAIVKIAWLNGTASGGSEAAVIEVSAPFEPGPGFTLGGEVPYQYGCVGFGRDTHAGSAGICGWKAKVDSSRWVTTESTGNTLQTSRFRCGFSPGSEATAHTFNSRRESEPKPLNKRL